MSVPISVSPFLRPFRREGRLWFDNPVTGQKITLEPLQEEILRALWTPESPEYADNRLEMLLNEAGIAPFTDGLRQLLQQMMISPHSESFEHALNLSLDSGCPAAPYVEQVELTNTCPMRCRFCPRGVPGRMARPQGHMSMALFTALLDQLNPDQSSYRPLELHHLGESLLHPEIVRCVALASERGLSTEVSVNPSLLEPDLGRGLLDAGLDRLVVSLDGMDNETLSALRGPAARYDRAERNLEVLLAHVAAMSPGPRVVIQMLDLHRNRHQREAFLARWNETSVPGVEAYVKPLDGPDPDADRRGEALAWLCTYPFRSVVVLWDGRVVPCCRDDDAHLVLGDLKEQTLAEIWGSEPARRLRDQHRFSRFPVRHLCEGCGWSRSRFAATMRDRHPDAATEWPLGW